MTIYIRQPLVSIIVPTYKGCDNIYIAFLDDDDYMFNDKIEKQVLCFEKLDKCYGIGYTF